MVGHFDDSVSVLEFVNSNQFDELADWHILPRSFLRTKIRPLVAKYDFRLLQTKIVKLKCNLSLKDTEKSIRNII